MNNKTPNKTNKTSNVKVPYPMDNKVNDCKKGHCDKGCDREKSYR